jgi:hypothetical protein
MNEDIFLSINERGFQTQHDHQTPRSPVLHHMLCHWYRYLLYFTQLQTAFRQKEKIYQARPGTSLVPLYVHMYILGTVPSGHGKPPKNTVIPVPLGAQA